MVPSALPLDHSSYAMGTSWSFGVWCLWSPCSMVQDTLCSLAVVASGEMQHRHENMLQELREPILAEEHFKYYQINIKSILFNRASKVFSPFQSWCTMNELLVLTKVPFRPVWNKCTMRYLEYPEEMETCKTKFDSLAKCRLSVNSRKSDLNRTLAPYVLQCGILYRDEGAVWHCISRAFEVRKKNFIARGLVDG